MNQAILLDRLADGILQFFMAQYAAVEQLGEKTVVFSVVNSPTLHISDDSGTISLHEILAQFALPNETLRLFEEKHLDVRIALYRLLPEEGITHFTLDGDKSYICIIAKR